MTSASGMVRRRRETDIPRIMEIEEISFYSPWTEDMFRVQLGMGDEALNLVMDDTYGIVGYAMAIFEPCGVHLISIAVIPDERGRGCAGRMLDSVLEEGRDRGMRRFVLEVREQNRAALGFYEARGFHVIGRISGYYSDTGEDALVMELDQDG